VKKFDACTCLIPGKILESLPGKPSLYPRIADEAYLRGAKYNPVSEGHVLYDPFCGIGGALISPSIIRRSNISQIFGSDTDADALAVARRNFSLTDLASYDTVTDGRTKAPNEKEVDPALLTQFREMLLHYGCGSPVPLRLFQHAMPLPVPSEIIPAESVSMVITDPPYGQMTSFIQGENGQTAQPDALFEQYVKSLRAIRPLLRSKATVTVICDRRQKLEGLLAGIPEYDYREAKKSKGQNFRHFHTLQAT
jgi:tRNA G10  N-methylase Trm11